VALVIGNAAYASAPLLNPGRDAAAVAARLAALGFQVIERRVDEVSLERQRAAARMTLRDRKAEEVYQDWVRQLRDNAYVEIRLAEER
jgi:peptidyl-prolyl cis-trans isomerase SurA